VRLDARILLRWLSSAGTTLLLSACAVGPDYKRPSAPVPAAYTEQTPGATRPAAPAPTPAPSGEWKPAEPADASARGKWWEAFGDPQLNALEERVSVSNQNIVIAEAQYRNARAVARGAKAEFFPTIAVAPGVTRSHAPITRTSALPGAPAGTATTYQLVGDVSYEVDVWGRIRRTVESKVEAAQASAADLETVRLSMHAELAVDYFLLQGNDSERELLASNVADDEKALQLTVNRHAQGVVSGVDVAQAETQLETTRAQLTELSITRAQLQNALAILVGEPPASFSIATAPAGAAPAEIPLELPSALLERRPDIAAAERSVASANAQIGVAQAAFFPALLLNATGGWEGGSLTRFFSAPNLLWSLGAALAQTIFDGGARIAGKEQAVAAYDATVAAYRQSVLGSFQEVEDNLATLRFLTAESAEQARAVAAARRALALAQSRYQGGITTYLEVVTAEAAALSNQRTAVDLETRRLTASVGLIKALGGGWDASSLPSPRAVLAKHETPPGGGSRTAELAAAPPQ